MTTWRGYTITQPFGVKNASYRLGYHPGTDFRFGMDVEQPAFAAGTARYHRDTGDGYGHTGTITLPNGDVIFYAHLKRNGILVTTGTRVEEMQPVFVTGSSGWVQLVHAHIEYRIGGNKNNPVDITKKLTGDTTMPTEQEVHELFTKYLKKDPTPDQIRNYTQRPWSVLANNIAGTLRNSLVAESAKVTKAGARIKELEGLLAAEAKPLPAGKWLVKE